MTAAAESLRAALPGIFGSALVPLFKRVSLAREPAARRTLFAAALPSGRVAARRNHTTLKTRLSGAQRISGRVMPGHKHAFHE